MTEDHDLRGVEMYKRVFGKPPGDDRTGLRALTIGYLFGEVWSRPALEPRLRSLLTVALTAANGWHAELAEHTAGAINLGWSREELLETMIHVAHYAGWPAGHSGQKVVLDAINPNKKALLALVLRIADAETKGDARFFEGLLHEKFVMRRANGGFVGKTSFLNDLKTDQERNVVVESVEILGKHRAMIKSVVKTLVDGATLDFDNLLVFIREEDDRWQLFCWTNEKRT